MRFSLLGQAFLASLAAIARADDCDDGPFAGSTVAGPPFPQPPDYQTQCDSHWKTGEIIVGIEAWSAKFQVKAVRFKYSQSGWSPVRGSIPETDVQAHQVTEWDAGKEVGIQLWNNKPDDGDPMDAVGRIIITQGGNNIFEVGANSGKTASNELLVDNGAGLMLAARTRSGAWLSSIEFKMLKSKVASTELIDLKPNEDMNDWNSKQKGIDHINLATVYFVNKNKAGGPNMTYSFTNTDSREASKKIVSQRTNQWTAGLKVTVGGGVEIPFLAKASVSVETSFQYQRTNMDGTEEAETTKKDLSIVLGTPGTSSLLGPGKAGHCESWAVSGRFDSSYTGTVEATLADGTKYRYEDTGDVTSVGWEKASTSCEEIDIKDVPAGVQIEEAQPTTSAAPSKRAVQFRG